MNLSNIIGILNTNNMSLKSNLITKFLNFGVMTGMITVLISTNLNINTYSQSIPTIKLKQDRTAPLNVAFKYGDQENSVKISSVAVSAVLSSLENTSTSQGFSLISANDIFAGDPSAENDKPAAPSNCYNFSEGSSYSISSTLISATKLDNYGPQTAKLVNGGAQIANLSANRTGCINLLIKVSPSAKVGDKTLVIFDQDTLSSPDYSVKPGKQQVILEIEAADQVAQPVATPVVNTPAPVASTPSISVAQVANPVTPVAQAASPKPATIITTARTGSAEIISIGLISLVLIVSLYFVARRFIPKYNM